MTNCNPETGIRYGVIAMNSIDPDLSQELWYGPGATDLSYQAAYDDAKAEAAASYDNWVDMASIAAAETDPNMTESERETFIEKWFEDHDLDSDREMFIERQLDSFSDQCQIDEPNIEGEYDGVKYLISWLGGAPLLWIVEGPIGFAKRLCSPCVPNAADLDGGYILEAEFNDEQHGEDYMCYCPPRDWLAEEV